MYHLNYRPKRFKEVIGNSQLVKSLKDMINKKECPHALLFSGNSGTGKTTLARIVATKVGAISECIYEINASNTRGIDTIREIIDNTQSKHILGLPKVFIFDESHALTSDAQNALLKVVEDCPEYVYFIFCTTRPEKLLTTLKNRCVQFETKPLSVIEARELFNLINKKEKLGLSDSFRDLILKYSEGCPRKILVNIFRTQTLSEKEAEILLENSVEGVKDEVIHICRMFLDPKKLKWVDIMTKLNNLLKEDNPESVRRMMFAYFATVLRNCKTNNEILYYTTILDTLDIVIEDTSQGINGLVFLLSKMYIQTIQK